MVGLRLPVKRVITSYSIHYTKLYDPANDVEDASGFWDWLFNMSFDGYVLFSDNASGNGEFDIDNNFPSNGLDVTSVDDIFSYFRDGSKPSPQDLRKLAEIIDKVINIYNEGSSVNKYHTNDKENGNKPTTIVITDKATYDRIVELREEINGFMRLEQARERNNFV